MYYQVITTYIVWYDIIIPTLSSGRLMRRVPPNPRFSPEPGSLHPALPDSGQGLDVHYS